MARLIQYSDIENAYDDPERVARLAGLVNELRDGETIVVGTGDTLAPGVCSLATRGGCALPFFEAIRPDAETFGNHDFDYGLDRTLEIVGESPQEWISANVFSEGDRFGVAEGVESSTVIETAGGTRVGFVGVTHPATTDMTPAAGALSITDPIEAIETVVEKLRPRVEFVCVLSHCGALDDEIARQCDVDCVLGGHVHDERISTVAGTICTRPNANGHRVCAVDLDAGTATFHETAAGPIDEVLRHRYETMRENVASTRSSQPSRNRSNAPEAFDSAGSAGRGTSSPTPTAGPQKPTVRYRTPAASATARRSPARSKSPTS